MAVHLLAASNTITGAWTHMRQVWLDVGMYQGSCWSSSCGQHSWRFVWGVTCSWRCSAEHPQSRRNPWQQPMVDVPCGWQWKVHGCKHTGCLSCLDLCLGRLAVQWTTQVTKKETKWSRSKTLVSSKLQTVASSCCPFGGISGTRLRHYLTQRLNWGA